MNFEIPIKILKELEESGGVDFSDHYNRWRGDYDTATIKSNILSETDIDYIEEIALKYKATEEDKNNRGIFSSLCRKLSTYKRLHKEAGTKKLKRLQDIPEAFKAFVKKNMPNGLIYQEQDGSLDPYIAISCDYEEYNSNSETPAHVKFSFRGIKLGHIISNSFTIWGEDLREGEEGGKTIEEILSDEDCLIESEEMNQKYQQYLDKFVILREIVGEVWVGMGKACIALDRYSEKPFFFKENISPKVIVDFKGRTELSSSRSDYSEEKIEYSNVLDKRVKLPLHTYGEVWHLEEHVWLEIHVNNLSPYKWKGKGLMDKLVLPSEDKELIEILMNMSKMKIEDIVEGKQGGSFILATGEPGTGKTLSAEVFSEVLERGLYKVQCSQLGIDVDTVEKKLKEILERASRWGAVLLLDEGDVYVRERGSDINQNAIVGVFLRTLEYYRGILFMTSNLETKVDDAILSRATAHLKYSIPTELERKRIWEILSRQFEIQFSMEELDELTMTFEDIVGRDIKALLKLGKMLSIGKDQPLTVDLIKAVAGFVPNVNNKVRRDGTDTR